MSNTVAVNKRTESYDVYIGRGTIFGNPFEIGVDGDRAQVLVRYKKWFEFLLRDERFVKELVALKGKRLGCFCKPLTCHGDVIASYLDSLTYES